MSVQQQICARSVKCLLCQHHPCMVRAATMLVGEGAVQGPLGGEWSERRVSCVLAAADVLATGTEWRQTTHQSRKKRSIGSQEGTIILVRDLDLPFGFPINNIISARKSFIVLVFQFSNPQIFCVVISQTLTPSGAWNFGIITL